MELLSGNYALQNLITYWNYLVQMYLANMFEAFDLELYELSYVLRGFTSYPTGIVKLSGVKSGLYDNPE